MEPTIIKKGRLIAGFVNQRAGGQWFYAFGKPSQSSYIAFDCDSKEAGINKVNQFK